MIFVKKGDTVFIDHISRNSSLVPTAADATPVVTLYAGADLAGKTNPLTSVTVTAITGETGAYVASRITTDLTAGTLYFALWSYQVATANRRELRPIWIA